MDFPQGGLEIPCSLLHVHDDELDQLLKNVQLVEPESDDGNVNNNTLHDDSQALLFETVGPPTDEAPNSEAGTR